MSCIYIYIHILWHSFWHILWHSISNSFWHSIWHLFWHTFWHILWHSFWHIFLTFYLASDLTFFLAFIRSATMSGILFGMYSGPCVAHSIRSWHRRSRQQRGGGGEGEGVAPLLKSRDPHLAGGIKKHKQLNYNLILGNISTAPFNAFNKKKQYMGMGQDLLLPFLGE